MSLDRRRVDQHLSWWPAGRRQGMKDVDPDAFGRPAHEAIAERLAWTVEGRSVDPAAAPTVAMKFLREKFVNGAIGFSLNATRYEMRVRFEP